jgi:D-cysteine desulfhydrase
MFTENYRWKDLMKIDVIKLDKFLIKSDLLVVRDDYYPFFQGGNKARKMVKIIEEIENEKCNAVVTTGGCQSNHCRVTALACAAKGWKCKIVLHGSEEEFMSGKGNALLMRLTGAEIEFVEPDGIRMAMKNSIEELIASGFRPYYLQGGGHNKPGILAYTEAIHELKQSLPQDFNVNHIFLTTGTGSTQAGLIAGCFEAGWEMTKVHGISAARRKEEAISGIIESLGFVLPDPEIFRNDIILYDDFLFGGYGKSDQILHDFVKDVAFKTGLILDETYTGKSFYGMINIIKKEKLSGNILFWHTGGLLNLMV